MGAVRERIAVPPFERAGDFLCTGRTYRGIRRDLGARAADKALRNGEFVRHGAETRDCLDRIDARKRRRFTPEPRDQGADRGFTAKGADQNAVGVVAYVT